MDRRRIKTTCIGSHYVHDVPSEKFGTKKSPALGFLGWCAMRRCRGKVLIVAFSYRDAGYYGNKFRLITAVNRTEDDFVRRERYSVRKTITIQR